MIDVMTLIGPAAYDSSAADVLLHNAVEGKGVLPWCPIRSSYKRSAMIRIFFLKDFVEQRRPLWQEQ